MLDRVLETPLDEVKKDKIKQINGRKQPKKIDIILLGSKEKWVYIS